MTVIYQFSKRVESGTITFELWHDGSVLATATKEYRPGSAADASESFHRLTMDLPSGLPDSDQYTILATHPKATDLFPG
jgi:hypothetical protein